MQHKWILMISVVCLLSVFMFGCVDEEEPVKAESSHEQKLTEITPTKTTPSTPSTQSVLNLKVGETARTSKLEVTVLSVQKTKIYQYYSDIIDKMLTEKAKPGKVFVIADVLIKNIGSDRIYISAGDFSLVDSEGYRYDPELYPGDDGLDFFKELYPNEKTKGKVLFEIPESATGLKIQYDFGNLFTGIKLATWTVS